ncbi:MAG: nitroreductase family protein [Candidatus Methanomethylophilaceae archaeon]|nr:nitroreductase family protein [Candidatus Methanomethylophilaceae archaeon]MBQ8643543.1 nitroreductase family protein [Candidatus Methanomethylophilaceae archaeon]
MGLFIDIARSRHSCRMFGESPLSDEEMRLILEAGELAPSSRNLHPVRLFPVSDTDAIRALAGCRPSSTTALKTATFAVVVAADPMVSDVWIEDCSIASIMMQLEAEDLGLGSCWIQVRLRSSVDGSAEDVVRNVLGLDTDLTVHSIIAIGKQ